MPLIVAGSAGYCYGVRRAMETALRSAQSGAGCVTLGPIIHNPQGVAQLAAAGVDSVPSPQDVPAGKACVIRSHGEPPETYRALEALGVPIVDATCPTVRRIHRLVEKAAQAGRRVIVVGRATHPEVRGILGWAGGQVQAVLTEAEALAVPPGEDDALVVSQTTLPAEKYERLCALLRRRIPHLEVVRTTCAATAARREDSR